MAKYGSVERIAAVETVLGRGDAADQHQKRGRDQGLCCQRQLAEIEAQSGQSQTAYSIVRHFPSSVL